MIAPCFVAGFTGHRRIGDPALICGSLQRVWAILGEAIGNGKLEVFSGIAYGSDTIAVETARSAGLPVHIMLPKIAPPEGNTALGFAADFWEDGSSGSRILRESDWKRAERQILDAKAGICGGTLRVTGGSQLEPDCYYESGVEMIEACDVLVTVWDKNSAAGLGGTADLVDFARKMQLPLIIIDANTGEISTEQLEKFADKNEPARVIVREINDACTNSTVANPETIDGLFDRLDRCSQHDSIRFRHSLVRIITLHGFATFVAALACILPHEPWTWKSALLSLALLEFGIIIAAVRKSQFLNKSHVHHRWVTLRFATELIRGLRHSEGLLDPLFPLVTRHDKTWRRFAITVGLTASRNKLTPESKHTWMNARDSYLRNRIRHHDRQVGQVEYFRSKQAIAEAHFRGTVRWSALLGASAVLFVFGAVLYKLQSLIFDIARGTDEGPSGLPITWTPIVALTSVAFSLLPVALPLAVGVILSLRTALDSGRRTYRYKEVTQFLKESANELENLRTESAVRRKVAEIEEVLLDELIEWRLAEQQNGAH